MPVGTLGTVKGVFVDDLKKTNTQIILGNTYHLMLRPGSAILDKFGGLHKFMNWNKPILTDSGGFQVMSLSKLNKIDKQIGAIFQSHIDVKKIPGRDLLKKLKLPNNIKSITILGNISDNSKNYLKKKFKRKIHHKNLPLNSIEKIKKTKINLKKNTLTFITLPTPKQEKLAFEIIKNNKNSKIICIGASIGIASGDEKEVPTFLKDYEFVWRLRSDFFRRLKRLFETLFYYTKENILDKKKNEIKFLKIY